MIRAFIAFAVLMLATVGAQAQSPVSVIGPVTPGDCPQFNSTTVIKDSGTPCNGGVGGFVKGPSVTSPGDLAIWKDSTGTLLADVVPNTVNVQSPPYNAACNGTTDDTAAIATALAAVPTGGTLALPNGLSCLVSGSGSAIFTLTTPINIVGQGMTENGVGSNLLIKSGVPTSRDIFHIVGVTNSTLAGYTFRNFNVVAQSSAVGQNVFHFDTTAGTTTNLASIFVDNVYADPNVSAGGYSVYLDNGTGTNTNGGEYTVTISNNYLGGGIGSSKTGDSIRVLNNLIHTSNAGVTLDQVSGAGGFYAQGNNISGTAGCFVVTQAIKPVWGQGNECEQQATNTEPNNAIIDIIASGTVSHALITSGQLQANSGTGNPTLIRNAGANTVIENMRLSTPAAYAHIVNAAAASGLVIGSDNAFSGGGSNITDSGSGTVYAPASKGTPLGVLGNVSSTATQPYADIVPSAVNQALVVNGNGSAVGFGQVQLGTGTPGVTGTLGAANGGTGVAAVGTGAGLLSVSITGVNFNSASSDTPIQITLPSGYTRWKLNSITISGASGTLTTSTAGVYTAVSQGGTPIVTTGAVTVSTASADTNNNMQNMTVNNLTSQSYTDATIQFHVAVAQGSAATANVTVFYFPMP